MLQVIRVIALAAIAVGVTFTSSDAIIVPAIMVILGAVLLKLSEVMDGEVHK